MKRMIALMFVLTLAGCGKDQTVAAPNTTSPPTSAPVSAGGAASTTQPVGSSAPAPSGSGATLKLADSSLGKILVDGSGMSLYLFTPDSAGKSTCNGGCASAWPPLVGTPTGDGLDANDLGVMTRDDGTKQATFSGHPLYRFAGDSAAGDVGGQGSGGKWFAIDAEGNAAGAASSPAKTSASTTTAAPRSGGY